mgnify:CR=1 FL=1
MIPGVSLGGIRCKASPPRKFTAAATPVEVAAITVREPEVLAAAPSDWERQLDPRSMAQARVLAKDMFDSRMFSAYGTPQGVLSTVMVGRELGLPAMASLRSIHNIDGRHAMSASLMVALILKSGLAEYFEPLRRFGAADDRNVGTETLALLREFIDLAVRAQRMDAIAIRMACNDVQRGYADRTRGSQYRDGLHG